MKHAVVVVLCRTLAVLLAAASLVAGAQAQNLPDFTTLVEDTVASIVHVSTSRALVSADDPRREQLEELLRYFYGEGNPDVPRGGASGSGFIISADGYIVTNHHVVEDAETITITLHDHREFEAELVGSDVNSDLAVLKIAAQGLHPARLGQSRNLKVGEWVLAIGSPFGLQYSVAAGIISYMGRSIPTGGANYVSYIQTDVAINPGHSGGPLLNLAGEVIGINSQIFTNSGGSIGLSFAIPVDVARNVITQLRDSGTVRRGYLGVGYEDVSPSLAEAFNLNLPHGALVNRVVAGSPAALAGIRTGDVVTSVDGQAVRTGADLPYLVGLLLPGTEITLGLVRNGEPLELSLELGTLDTPQLSRAPQRPQVNPAGLVLRTLTDEERAAFEVESGVMIEAVSGAAAAAGLMAGDVIMSLNLVTVDSPRDVEAILAELPADKAIPVLIARGGQQNFHTLRLGSQGD
jgi:serine protease Do